MRRVRLLTTHHRGCMQPDVHLPLTCSLAHYKNTAPPLHCSNNDSNPVTGLRRESVFTRRISPVKDIETKISCLTNRIYQGEKCIL
jgi:hypothetical protein